MKRSAIVWLLVFGLFAGACSVHRLGEGSPVRAPCDPVGAGWARSAWRALVLGRVVGLRAVAGSPAQRTR